MSKDEEEVGGKEIFTGPPVSNKESEESQEDNVDKTINQNINMSKDADKERAGFYLREDVQEALERAWFESRKVMGEKVSKSQIVNVALKSLLEDFFADPDNNYLVNEEWKS